MGCASSIQRAPPKVTTPDRSVPRPCSPVLVWLCRSRSEHACPVAHALEWCDEGGAWVRRAGDWVGGGVTVSYAWSGDGG